MRRGVRRWPGAPFFAVLELVVSPSPDRLSLHPDWPRIPALPARASRPGRIPARPHPGLACPRIPALKIFVSWLHPKAEFCFLAAKPGFWAGFGFKTCFCSQNSDRRKQKSAAGDLQGMQCRGGCGAGRCGRMQLWVQIGMGGGLHECSDGLAGVRICGRNESPSGAQ